MISFELTDPLTLETFTDRADDGSRADSNGTENTGEKSSETAGN
jgi:hypothetical protein